MRASPATLPIPEKDPPSPFGDPAKNWATSRPPVTIDLQDGGNPVTLATPTYTFGRPTNYTPALGAMIVDLFRQGQVVQEIAKNDWAPESGQLYRWLDMYPDFRESVARARAVGASAMADRAIDIADNADIMSKAGVARARLQVDARFRLASVYDRRFSDRQIVTHEHTEVGQSIDMQGQDVTTLAVQLTKLLAKAQAIDVDASPAPDAEPNRTTGDTDR